MQAPWVGGGLVTWLTLCHLPRPEVEAPALLGDRPRRMRQLLAPPPDRHSLSV